MRRSSMLCLDANILIRRVTEPDNASIQDLWRGWRSAQREFVAPVLLRFEVTNALHRLRRARVVSDRTTHLLLDAALAESITLYADQNLHAAALDFAARFDLPAAYDAHYLALADRLDVEFWTADRRLAHTVRQHLPWVRLAE